MTYFDREIQLSTGVRCSLQTVSGCLGLLASHLEDAHSRDCIHALRQMCIGKEVSANAREALLGFGLLENDGTLHPVMKAVVLASVRGEDHALYIVSPFTTSWDRTLSEFLAAKDHIRAELPKEEADRIITEKDPLPDALLALRLKRGRTSSGGHSLP